MQMSRVFFVCECGSCKAEMVEVKTFTVDEFAKTRKVSCRHVIHILIGIGVMATVNQTLKEDEVWYVDQILNSLP